ncbi:hypothetical protein HK104_005186, partial [Borealophlyctis nickersoniae]
TGAVAAPRTRPTDTKSPRLKPGSVPHRLLGTATTTVRDPRLPLDSVTMGDGTKRGSMRRGHHLDMDMDGRGQSQLLDSVTTVDGRGRHLLSGADGVRTEVETRFNLDVTYPDPPLEDEHSEEDISRTPNLSCELQSASVSVGAQAPKPTPGLIPNGLAGSKSNLGASISPAVTSFHAPSTRGSRSDTPASPPEFQPPLTPVPLNDQNK